MFATYPQKLHKESHVRVIAPSRSLALPWITDSVKSNATNQLNEMGLRVTVAPHALEKDAFDSSSVNSRREDLHQAFRDSDVQLALTAIGGFNSNQLFPSLDWELMATHPTLLCGFSDITALANALWAKTGLVTYSGPHFSSFGMEQGLEYTVEYFQKCLFGTSSYDVQPAEYWSDDLWALKQNQRHFEKNEGWWVLQEGEAEGRIIGGNLCTLNLLQGTPFMPSLSNALLFLEDDYEVNAATFDRDLTSLIQQKDFHLVQGIVIGRFQKASKITRALLQSIVDSKKELRGLPILANADFGHTTPIFTFPIGGYGQIRCKETDSQIRIMEH